MSQQQPECCKQIRAYLYNRLKRASHEITGNSALLYTVKEIIHKVEYPHFAPLHFTLHLLSQILRQVLTEVLDSLIAGEIHRIYNKIGPSIVLAPYVLYFHKSS